MAIATSVSSPGKGGLPGRDLQPALQRCRLYFYPLCDLLSQKLCPLSFVPFSLSVLIPCAFWFWVGPSSSLSLFSFFIVAVDRWGDVGGRGRSVTPSYLLLLGGN